MKRQVAQFEWRTVFGMAGQDTPGPVAVGNGVIQAGAATEAIALIEGVAEADIQRIIDLQR
ncbi:hypothetical protein D3C85_1729210 [compost metagenome]